MSSQPFDETKHPRNPDGKFGTKPAEEAATSLPAPSPVAAAYAEAEPYEGRVRAAKEQIEELTNQADRDSARQLGCFLRALHPGATHARLVWEEDRWYLNNTLAANGNELDIDWDSGTWHDSEDAIDYAVSQISPNVADRPAIGFSHGDGELSNGDEAVVDVRPAQ